jgi:hypothetical protein
LNIRRKSYAMKKQPVYGNRLIMCSRIWELRVHKEDVNLNWIENHRFLPPLLQKRY